MKDLHARSADYSQGAPRRPLLFRIELLLMHPSSLPRWDSTFRHFNLWYSRKLLSYIGSTILNNICQAVVYKLIMRLTVCLSSQESIPLSIPLSSWVMPACNWSSSLQLWMRHAKTLLGCPGRSSHVLTLEDSRCKVTNPLLSGRFYGVTSERTDLRSGTVHKATRTFFLVDVIANWAVTNR